MQSVKNLQTKHQDTTGMGFSRQEKSSISNQSQKAERVPAQAEKKKGRNEKIVLLSPSGQVVEVKYKKLQHYLNQGYTQQS